MATTEVVSMVTNESAKGRIVRKRVASLRPSPENLSLYRPTEDDPDIQRLAESIEKNGLLEPLVVTEDRYIVSGHRRHAALCLLGQKFVSCRVLNIRRDSLTTDAYIALLRDHNHQRNKTVAEQVREEVVDINAQDAYQRLVASRTESVCRTAPGRS
jgi:ParB-like chromosome segregation protein Spo0J